MYMVHTLVAIALKSCIDRDDILMDVTSNVSNFPQLIDPTFIGYGLCAYSRLSCSGSLEQPLVCLSRNGVGSRERFKPRLVPFSNRHMP